jgi:hypothetical protein
LKSKIINMAEHLKDADDRLLESLFASEPLADDGFSERIVRRIRRRLWVRRFALAAALSFGGVIALKPTLALSGFVLRQVQNVSGGLPGIDLNAIPSTTMLVGGALLFLVTVLGARLLED